MNITGHMRQKYHSASESFLSSAGRDWTNVLAEVWSHHEADYSGITPVDTEIAILLKGKTRVKRKGDGATQDMVGVPGTVWICPAGIREEQVYVWGEMEEVIHLFIPAQPFSESALKEFDLDPGNVQLRYEGGFQDPFIEQIGRSVAAELKSECPASRLLVDSLGVALSAHILKNYSNITPDKLSLDRSKGALDQRRLDRIRDYILSNIDRNITLEELAAEACLSPFHFTRAFKTAVGVTPHQFVMEEKLKLAKRMLLDQQASLSDVACITGFSTQAHFTRMFKQLTGLTPGAYRAKLIR